MDLRAQLQNTFGESYTIERELGGGGMSRVFLATDQSLGRSVVVKVPNETAGAVSIERFRREIRLAASLQQANIVPVLSSGDAGGFTYYTMPFVKGESLRSHLAANGALPVSECVAILRDVARALAFAHAEGVIHRDIKPENILLSGGTAVVADFGIAKAVAASSDQSAGETLTQHGMTVGTPAYVAPEQALGEPVDHRADIYSLGVVAYEMLTGTTPFAGRSAQAMVAAHVIEEPPALAEKRRDAPAGLVALVMRCLAKEQADRPESATAVLSALEGTAVHAAVGVMTTYQIAVAPLPAKDGKPSIAVLPFENLTSDPADEYFADGMTDEVITDLSAIHTLRVIARPTMMRFKGSGKEPRIVAREVNTRYALDGSVRRARGAIRLTARLTDTSDGSVIWSEKMNAATVDDVFAIQEALSRSIVSALQIALTPDEDRLLRARPIEDIHAYECYLRARHEIWGFTGDGRARAIHLLENGLSFGAESALIHATLGFAHLQGYHLGAKPDAAMMREAFACARRAIALEPDSPQAHAVLGAAYCISGQGQPGVRELTSALALAPGNTDALFQLSWYYSVAGFVSHAIPLADRLAAIDPLTPISRGMPGWVALLDGRIEDAVPPYETMYAMDPGSPFTKWALAVMLAFAEQDARSCALFETILAEAPETPFAWHGRMLTAALRGNREQVLAAVTPNLIEWARPQFQFCWFVADAYARVGEREAALEWLQQAVRLGFLNYRFMSMFDVHLRSLRSDPAFEAIVAEARRQHEAFEP